MGGRGIIGDAEVGNGEGAGGEVLREALDAAGGDEKDEGEGSRREEREI